MGEIGIPTWEALQKQSGLTRTSLRQLRNGDANRVKLSQLSQLATALHWDMEVLLQKFGVVSESRAVAPTPKETVSQEASVQDATPHQPGSEALLAECVRLGVAQ